MKNGKRTSSFLMQLFNLNCKIDIFNFFKTNNQRLFPIEYFQQFGKNIIECTIKNYPRDFFRLLIV